MDNESICIKRIEATDNREIAELIRTVFREFGIDRPGTVYTDPTTDNLYALFQQQQSEYLICLVNGKMAGGCGIFPTPGLPDGCAELVKFYITASFRGQGYGKLLMEKCFEAARNMGFTHLYLETMPELGKAIGMYEKSGFKSLSHPLGNSGHFGCDIWMLKTL